MYKRQGQGFTALVKENQKVSAGTPLQKVDLDAVRAAGHPTATAIIVTDGAGAVSYTHLDVYKRQVFPDTVEVNHAEG